MVARTRPPCRAIVDMVRVDHAVGFYRTYSFGPDPEAPGEFYPRQEDQQRDQGERFFRMLKQEIGEDALIGEDLGTVPPWVRVSLSQLGVLGLKVFRWEKKDWRTPRERFIPPAEYPQASVAVTGTHDTECVVKWWRAAPQSERKQLAAAFNFSPQLDISAADPGIELLDAILDPLYAAPS